MNRAMMMATLPLLTFGLVAGYSSHSDTAKAAPAGGDCTGGKVVRVGDKVAVSLSNTALNWDTSGSFVTLTDRSNKQVELVVGTGGSPSPAKGDCLRSGSFIRFASTNQTTGPNRYLQAYQGPDAGVGADPSHVVIGNFPDPLKYSNFSVLKVSGPVGSVIERGDEVVIRGTQKDPWLMVPPNPDVGTPVGLVPNPNSDDPSPNAAKWKFGNKDDDN